MWSKEGKAMLGPATFIADTGLFYTFNDLCVTCEKCKEK